jgi:hypothetical protein
MINYKRRSDILLKLLIINNKQKISLLRIQSDNALLSSAEESIKIAGISNMQHYQSILKGSEVLNNLLFF